MKWQLRVASAPVSWTVHAHAVYVHTWPKSFISHWYRTPELFLAVIDGQQNIPLGLVIKQEVWRVPEQQTRSWLTPPSQTLTDLLLRRPEEGRRRMKGSHRLSIKSIWHCVTCALWLKQCYQLWYPYFDIDTQGFNRNIIYP